MTRLLEISGLTLTGSASPGGAPLVDNLSLTLEQGEILAVLGENGAGKSLTALAALGFLPEGVCRTSGRVCLEGRDLDSLGAEDLRALRGGRASMIMQNPMSAFNPLLSIRGHFAESLSAHGQSAGKKRTAQAAARALAEAGFAEPDGVLDIYPFQMSGGMLQRVMIALALLHGPRLLIADEATTDLDLAAQKQIVELLRERRQSLGLGVLLVTHDLGVAAALADRVAVLRRGRLLEEGKTTQVFTAPRDPYTKALLAAHLGLSQGRFTDFFANPAGAGHAS